MSRRRVLRLIEAVWNDEVDEVRALLESGVPPGAPEKDPEELSALRPAVCNVNVEMVELLLQHGADGSEADDDDSVLHRALEEDPTDPAVLRIVELLVTHGAELEARDHAGETPLIKAVRSAVKKGPLTAKDSEELAQLQKLFWAPGGTSRPICLESEPRPDDAARYQVIGCLLDHGADIEGRDTSGSTALMIAALKQDDLMVDWLLARGARDEGQPEVQLLEAVLHEEEERVAALLAAGADPDRRFPRLGTPLTSAVELGNMAIIELLLEAGADPNLAEEDSPEGDFTPLVRAAYGGHLRIVERLLEAGADPCAPGPYGETALDYAKTGQDEGHVEGNQWPKIIDLLRRVSAHGPPRLQLRELPDKPGVVVELERNRLIASIGWRGARIGDLELFESAPLQAPGNWDGVRTIAARNGFAAVLVAWSLDDQEPRLDVVESELAAIDGVRGVALLERLEKSLRQAAAEEAEELAEEGEDLDDGSFAGLLDGLASAAIPDGSKGIALPVQPMHLVLVSGAAEQVALIYRFGQCELAPSDMAAILCHWRELAGAELAAFDGANMHVVLPQPLSNETLIRRLALELVLTAPELEDPRSALKLAASRYWWFWWD